MEGERVVTIDARPVKDFNRETCKGALSFPAAIRKGGLSDFVDEPDVERVRKESKRQSTRGDAHHRAVRR